MSRDDPKFMVRLPPHMKQFVADEAAKNGCSQNSEIIRAIRERMERVSATGVQSPNEPPVADRNTTDQEIDHAGSSL